MFCTDLNLQELAAGLAVSFLSAQNLIYVSFELYVQNCHAGGMLEALVCVDSLCTFACLVCVTSAGCVWTACRVL